MEAPQGLQKREQYHVKAASVKPLVKMKTKNPDYTCSGVTKQDWNICIKTHTQNGETGIITCHLSGMRKGLIFDPICKLIS